MSFYIFDATGYVSI